MNMNRKNILKNSLLFFGVLLAGFAMLISSCAVGTSDGDDGERKETVSGSTNITIHLLYAPKSVTYNIAADTKQGGWEYKKTTGDKTDAFIAHIWAWASKSGGDVNYTEHDWPGANEHTMKPYDKNGEPIKKNGEEIARSSDATAPFVYPDLNDVVGSGHRYDEVFEWRLSMKVDSNGTFGILFNDMHAFTYVDSQNYHWEQTCDILIPKEEIQEDAEFYFIYNKTDYYKSLDEALGLKSAMITNTNGKAVEVALYGNGSKTYTAADFTVKDSSDATLSVSSIATNGSTVTLTLSSGDITKLPYKVQCDGATVYAYLQSKLIDSAKLYPEGLGGKAGGQLGLIYNDDGTVSFVTWAPTAQSVKLLFFQDKKAAGVKGANPNAWSTKPAEPGNSSLAKSTDMTKVLDDEGKWDGTWSITVNKTEAESWGYYKYRLTFADKKLTSQERKLLRAMRGNDPAKKFEWINTVECMRLEGEEHTFDVPDIWAKVFAPDSTATQIIDVDDEQCIPAGWEEDYTNPFSKDDTVARDYAEAVISELGVADTNDGAKFAQMSDDVILHLKDLGVTHVSLLPITDYVYTNVDTRYNWGFCPFNYNGIESRYVVGGEGADAVRELRAFIQKFHNAGIAVIMDVAFSHTGNNKVGLGSQSLYDAMVPDYFYRMRNGSPSNGSNYGSELASERLMAKKLVTDCLVHWMEDFHVNGFQFFLMGLALDTTMEDIYSELCKIDKSVLVFGEPWGGGRSDGISSENGSSASGAQKALKSDDANGVAVFDTNFRDAVKGKELRGFTRGVLQGYPETIGGYATKNAENVDALVGLLPMTCTSGVNDTAKASLTVHYIETHDDLTLFDKLLISLDGRAGADTGSYQANVAPLYSQLNDDVDKYIETVKSEDLMGAALIILSKGIPFMSYGQEFLRTKKGNADSSEAGTRREQYWSDNEVKACNKLDFERAMRYRDVTDAYRGLLAFRCDNIECFKTGSVTATEVATGVIKYEVTKGTTVITAIFNTTDTDFDASVLNLGGYKVDFGGSYNATGVDGAGFQTFAPKIDKYKKDATATQITNVKAKGFVVVVK